MSSTIVCVYICTVCTEHYPFGCRRPSCRCYALLDSFFKCIRQTMPAIAVVIESVEASMRSELDTKAWNISSTHVKIGVDEPGLQLWGKVMSSCRGSEIRLISSLDWSFGIRNRYSLMIFPCAFRAPRKKAPFHPKLMQYICSIGFPTPTPCSMSFNASGNLLLHQYHQRTVACCSRHTDE